MNSFDRHLGVWLKNIALSVIIVWVPTAYALPQTPHSQISTHKMNKPAKPKLTSRQMEGLRLLKSLQAEADGMEPTTAAFVLSKIASAYSSVDRATEIKVLRRAFLTTLTIESPAEGESCPRTEICGMKSDLQSEILGRLLRVSNSSAEELLSSAEPKIRNSIGDRIWGNEFDQMLSRRNYEKAKQLLSERAESDEYPYYRAAQLILTLPAKQSAERQAIFSEAVHNFQQYKQESADSYPSPSDGLSKMIVDAWQRLPPAAVVDAITDLVDEAKSESDENNLHTTVTTRQGGVVSLTSRYEIRLFELLPVLSELDPAKAEGLLRDNDALRAALQNSPRGMQSMQTMTMSMTRESGPPSAEIQTQAAIDGRTNAVIEKAVKDPKQALSEALGLPLSGGSWPPDGCPRLSALEAVVQAAAKKDKLVAESALDEIMKLADQLSPIQYHQLGGVLPLYFLLGDEEGEKKAVNALAKIAQKLYGIDSDPNNPNVAFKGFWPSTAIWRRCIQFAGKLSPALAREILADISDPDIAAVEKVVYASSLLGGNIGGWDIAINYRTRKNNAPNDFMTGDE